MSQRPAPSADKSVHVLLSKRLARIEQTRVQLGYPQVFLARKAGIGRQTYLDALSGRKAPRDTTLKKLEDALIVPRKEKEPVITYHATIRIAYTVIVLSIAGMLNVAPDEAFVQNLRRRATKNGARLRNAAVYLIYTVHGVSQRHIAAALSYTPAAISQAIKSAEAQSSDSAIFDALSKTKATLEALRRYTPSLLDIRKY